MSSKKISKTREFSLSDSLSFSRSWKIRYLTNGAFARRREWDSAENFFTVKTAGDFITPFHRVAVINCARKFRVRKFVNEKRLGGVGELLPAVWKRAEFTQCENMQSCLCITRRMSYAEKIKRNIFIINITLVAISAVATITFSNITGKQQ